MIANHTRHCIIQWNSEIFIEHMLRLEFMRRFYERFAWINDGIRNVCACVFGLCNATHSIAIRRIYTFQWAFRLWAIHSTRWHASIQNSEIICSEFLCDHRCRACHRLSLCLLSMRLHGELLSICHKTDVSCYKNWCYAPWTLDKYNIEYFETLTYRA